jgi:hypothetical protein
MGRSGAAPLHFCGDAKIRAGGILSGLAACQPYICLVSWTHSIFGSFYEQRCNHYRTRPAKLF